MDIQTAFLVVKGKRGWGGGGNRERARQAMIRFEAIEKDFSIVYQSCDNKHQSMDALSRMLGAAIGGGFLEGFLGGVI